MYPSAVARLLPTARAPERASTSAAAEAVTLGAGRHVLRDGCAGTPVPRRSGHRQRTATATADGRHEAGAVAHEVERHRRDGCAAVVTAHVAQPGCGDRDLGHGAAFTERRIAPGPGGSPDALDDPSVARHRAANAAAQLATCRPDPTTRFVSLNHGLGTLAM